MHSPCPCLLPLRHPQVPPIDISTLPNAIRISRPSVFTFTAAPGAWRKLAEDVLDRIQKGKLKVGLPKI